MRAKGVKVLQTPSIYIGAVIGAFALYYIDRSYGFNYIFAKAKEEVDAVQS